MNQQGLKSLIVISGPRYQGLLSWFLDVGRLTSANDWMDQWMMLMDFCETTWIYRYHDIMIYLWSNINQHNQHEPA